MLFIYGAAAAVILIAIVAHYYMPMLMAKTQSQAEYAALRDVAPILILAQDGKSVHICINSTAPQRVLVQRSGTWVEAQRNCRVSPDGRCVSDQSAPLCRWYLGAYRPGDSLTVVLRGNYATVAKNYVVSAIPVSR